MAKFGRAGQLQSGRLQGVHKNETTTIMKFFRIGAADYVNVSAVVRVRLVPRNKKSAVEIQLVTGEKIKVDEENGSKIYEAAAAAC